MRFQTAHTPNSLTEGPIAQTLIAFALPLFLGNLFQQLYNTADSLIVGNFLGSEALAAVSSSGTVSYTHLDVYKRQPYVCKKGNVGALPQTLPRT